MWSSRGEGRKIEYSSLMAGKVVPPSRGIPSSSGEVLPHCGDLASVPWSGRPQEHVRDYILPAWSFLLVSYFLPINPPVAAVCGV